jgi:hypothetical protein
MGPFYKTLLHLKFIKPKFTQVDLLAVHSEYSETSLILTHPFWMKLRIK